MSGDTRAVIERFHAAVNDHDLDSLTRLVHENCVFETTDPPDGTRHVGRAAVLAAFQAFLAESPDARFEIEELVVTGDRGLVRWIYHWTDGHVRGVDVVRVRDDAVAETFAYVKG